MITEYNLAARDLIKGRFYKCRTVFATNRAMIYIIENNINKRYFKYIHFTLKKIHTSNLQARYTKCPNKFHYETIEAMTHKNYDAANRDTIERFFRALNTLEFDKPFKVNALGNPYKGSTDFLPGFHFNPHQYYNKYGLVFSEGKWAQY